MPDLSVVIPVRNEAAHLGQTLDMLVGAVHNAGVSAEVIVVDDGSTDGTAEVALNTVADRLPLRVLRGPAEGRFRARRRGIEAAESPTIVLLDARVRLLEGSLAFVTARQREGEEVWTSHVHVETGSNLFAIFWKLIADLGWREYFDDPRTVAFGPEDFDRYPKGTTCFVAPRAILLEAGDAFSTRYSNLSNANDDTTMLRWIAARRPINLSPSFAVSYSPRTSLRLFWRHSIHRGVVFLDGHGRLESRFFPGAVLFFPVSALLAISTVRRPSHAPRYVVGVAALGALIGVRARRSPDEIAALALAGPVYGLGHAIGMWKGLALALLGRRPGARP